MSNVQKDEWEQYVPEGEWTEVKKKDRSKAKKIPAALPTSTRARSPPASPMKSPPATPAPTVPALIATPPVSASSKNFPNPAAATTAPASSSKDEKYESSPPPLSSHHWPTLAKAHNPMDSYPSWADQVDGDEAEEAAFRERMQAIETTAVAPAADEGTFESEGDDAVMPTTTTIVSSVRFSVGGVQEDDGDVDNRDDGQYGGYGDDEDHGDHGDHGDEGDGGDHGDSSDHDDYGDRGDSGDHVDDEDQGGDDEYGGSEEQEGDEDQGEEEDYQQSGEQGGDNEGDEQPEESDDIERDEEHGAEEAYEGDAKDEEYRNDEEDERDQRTGAYETGGDYEDWNDEAEALQSTDPDDKEGSVEDQSDHEAPGEEIQLEQVYGDEEKNTPEQDEPVNEPAEDPQIITARLENMLRSSAKSLGKQSIQEQRPVQKDQKPDWMQDPQWDAPPRPPSPEILRKPAPQLQVTIPKHKSADKKQKDIDSEGFETVPVKAKKTVTFSQEPEIRSYVTDTTFENSDKGHSGASAANVLSPEPPQPPRYIRAPEEKPAVPGALFVEEQSVVAPSKTRKRVKSKSRNKKKQPSGLASWALDDDPVPAEPEPVKEQVDEQVEAGVPQPAAVEQQAVVTHSKKARKRGRRAKKKALVGGGGEVEEKIGGGEVQSRTAREWLVDRPTYEIWTILGGSVLVLLGIIMMLSDWYFK